MQAAVIDQTVVVSPSQAPRGGLRKYGITVPAGRMRYLVVHNLGTTEVIVQTRIAGRVREGGVAVVDTNTVQLDFGGVLNEAMDVVIIG